MRASLPQGRRQIGAVGGVKTGRWRGLNLFGLLTVRQFRPRFCWKRKHYFFAAGGLSGCPGCCALEGSI